MSIQAWKKTSCFYLMSSQVFEQLSTNMSLAQNKNLLHSCHGCFLSFKLPKTVLEPTLPTTPPVTLFNTNTKNDVKYEMQIYFGFEKMIMTAPFFWVSFSMPSSLVLKPVANRSCSLWNQNEEEEEEVIKLSVFKEKDFFPKDFHLLVHLDMDTQIVVVQPGASNLILE